MTSIVEILDRTIAAIRPSVFVAMSLDDYATLLDGAQYHADVTGEEADTTVREGITKNGEPFYALQVLCSGTINVIYPNGLAPKPPIPLC